MKKATLILFTLSLVLPACTPEPATSQKHEDHPAHQIGPDELHLTDQQILLANIVTDSVRERTLGNEFRINGVVAVDQAKVTSVSSRVMGRIEKLYFKNTGERVSKGDVLYEIYSEDLNMTIRELKLALEKTRVLKNNQSDMQTILESARSKLQLYGLSEQQIKELENKAETGNALKIYSQVSGIILSIDVKEGDYLMEGAIVIHLADLSTLWIEGQVYSDYSKLIKHGAIARVTFPDYPEKKHEGVITFINPELNSASKINIVRVPIPNEQQELRPGTQAYINVLTNQITAIALPTDAIILDGKGATVWIETGKNTFKSKMVKTGLESNGYTQITDGLGKGDKVVVNGAYLVNSEYIFQKGTNPMEGHDMSKM